MSTQFGIQKKMIGPIMATTSLCILALLGYGNTRAPKNIDHKYFETDASGKLREVKQPSRPIHPLPKLWKPEPELIQQNSSKLLLSAEQKQRLAQVFAAWKKVKTDLEGGLNKASAVANPQGSNNVSIATIKQDLVQYSELSRLYDANRAQYWELALAILTDPQRAILEEVGN